MNSPSEFEIKVIRLAVAVSVGKNNNLWRQINFLKVKKRTATGCGFYTDFELSKPIDGFFGRLDTPISVNARKKSPEDGLVFFIIWLNETGHISQLEAVSAEDCLWPESIFEGFYDFQDDEGNLIKESVIID